MPDLSSRGIFLSYRREDAAPYARLLQLQLSERIPDARVFMDLDSIEAGLDFAEVIREAVESCAILVALIGRQWATLADNEGRRRLDHPDDYVRFEIQAALERGIRVIPVLVDGARPVQQQELPDGLRRLARLNALELSYGRYQYDADRLLALIGRVLAEVPADPSEASAGGQEEPEAVRIDPARAGRALIEAERIARSITNVFQRVDTLADVAAALTATDPDHAARLVAEAERAAGAGPGWAGNTMLLGMAIRLAAAPDHAERIAAALMSEFSKAAALTDIAEALAATDATRAARLLAEAERTALTITDEDSKARALTGIARAVAATDPDRADRIAQYIYATIADEDSKGIALADIAWALAAGDPERADRVAQSITPGSLKAYAIAGVAVGRAATAGDPAAWLFADAERIARSITDNTLSAFALARIAETLAVTDPDQAERVAESVASDPRRASAKAKIAGTVAARDPDRAERIAASIADDNSKAQALADIAGAVAAADPDRAERIAASLTDEFWQVQALVAMAKAWRLHPPAGSLSGPQQVNGRGAEGAGSLPEVVRGDPRGFPVLAHHGTPGSRHIYGRAAADAAVRGLRLISYDRPGYGKSAPRPGRTVADCASDVRAICQALSISRLALWGGSGGGPHVLACAALLPDLVTAAAALASLAPYGAEGLDWFAGMGQEGADDFRALLTDDQLAADRFEQHRAEALAATADSIAGTMEDFLTPPDAAVLTGDLAEYAVRCDHDGLAPGSRGWHDDNRAHISPWGFGLSDIRIPGAEARLLSQDGHLTLTANRLGEVHAWLADQSTLHPGRR